MQHLLLPFVFLSGICFGLLAVIKKSYSVILNLCFPLILLLLHIVIYKTSGIPLIGSCWILFLAPIVSIVSFRIFIKVKKYITVRKYSKIRNSLENNESIRNVYDLIDFVIHEDDKSDYYQKSLLLLKNDYRDIAIKYLLKIISSECEREAKFMRKLLGGSCSSEPYHHINKKPTKLLSEIGDSSIVPYLKQMLHLIPESVEYYTFYDESSDAGPFEYSSNMVSELGRTIEILQT